MTTARGVPMKNKQIIWLPIGFLTTHFSQVVSAQWRDLYNTLFHAQIALVDRLPFWALTMRTVVSEFPFWLFLLILLHNASNRKWLPSLLFVTGVVCWFAISIARLLISAD